MKCYLTTRCGCTREIVTPVYPPSPTIVVPLRRQNPGAAETEVPFETRTFKLVHFSNYGPGAATTSASYEEAEECTHVHRMDITELQDTERHHICLECGQKIVSAYKEAVK